MHLSRWKLEKMCSLFFDSSLLFCASLLSQLSLLADIHFNQLSYPQVTRSVQFIVFLTQS